MRAKHLNVFICRSIITIYIPSNENCWGRQQKGGLGLRCVRHSRTVTLSLPQIGYKCGCVSPTPTPGLCVLAHTVGPTHPSVLNDQPTRLRRPADSFCPPPKLNLIFFDIFRFPGFLKLFLVLNLSLFPRGPLVPQFTQPQVKSTLRERRPTSIR